jgi:sugar O-acyltransferase (sialic acid O-acetyltransferase NeuD family)
MMSREPLILIGAGGHCKSVIDIIEQLDNWSVAGIVGLPEEKGNMILGYPVIGEDNDLEELTARYKNFHISLGFIKSPERRIEIWKRLAISRVKMPVIVSPYAYVSKHARIGAGTIVMHFAVVNAGSSVGENSIINTRALVEHDAVIGAHSHIATGAIINGGVTVGEATFIGSGAVTRQGVVIPERSFIKANSLVRK